MRSQSYGDKQRDEQQRKKQEDLWKKAHPEGAPASEPPVDAGKADASKADAGKPEPAPTRTKKKKSPARSSS